MKAKNTSSPASNESFVQEQLGGSRAASMESDSSPQQQMVAEAAYFLAEQRGFEAGYEVNDWLQAEAKLASARMAEA